MKSLLILIICIVLLGVVGRMDYNDICVIEECVE